MLDIRCAIGFLIVCLLSLCVHGVTLPLWDVYKWGSNYLAWCRFPCEQKLNAGNIFRISLSGRTKDFKKFGNLKLLSRNGTDYIVENNYDIWGDGQHCQFQFGMKYTGINLSGNCSYYDVPKGLQERLSKGTPKSLPKQPKTPKPPSVPKGPSGLDIAVWANRPDGTLFRYKGRCTAPCTGTYQPGTLRVKIDVDKLTTNFNGYGKFKPVVPSDSVTRSWTVVNKDTVPSVAGLCNVDFQFDHQSEFPLPKGSCYVL